MDTVIRVMFTAIGISFVGLFTIVLLTAALEPLVRRLSKRRWIEDGWNTIMAKLPARRGRSPTAPLAAEEPTG